MKKKVISNAIVLFARSWSALAAVRSLGKKGVHVYTGDTISSGTATFSKYSKESFIYPDPHKEEKFISFMVDYCKKVFEKSRGEILILPIHEETYILSKYRNRFPGYVNLVLPENSVLQKVNHKGEIINLAKKCKVNMPPSWYCKNKKQAEKIANKLEYPAFIKDPDSSGSTGVYKAKNVREYKKLISKIKMPKVIQSFIPGKDYCCCCLFNHGKPVILFTYTAIQTYPARGGSTVYRKTVSEPKIEEQALKFLKGLKWHGVAELDFRINAKTKKAVMIEANPRFWGALNQATRSNVDFPYLVLRLAEGEKLKRITKFRKDIRTANLSLVLAATVQELQDLKGMDPSIEMFLKKPSIKNYKAAESFVKKFILKDIQFIIKNYSKKKVFEDFYDEDDPKAMAGILFPLRVYAKYGKINDKLLIRASAKEARATKAKKK